MQIASICIWVKVYRTHSALPTDAPYCSHDLINLTRLAYQSVTQTVDIGVHDVFLLSVASFIELIENNF